MKRMNEIVDITTEGFNFVFNRIKSLFNPVFFESTDTTFLDFEYLTNKSGTKFISNLMLQLNSVKNEGKLSSEDVDFLARFVYNKFGNKWSRIYNVLTLDYKPLENYSMTEVETPDFESTSITKTASDFTTTSNNKRSGFNTIDPVETDIITKSSVKSLTWYYILKQSLFNMIEKTC